MFVPPAPPFAARVVSSATRGARSWLLSTLLLLSSATFVRASFSCHDFAGGTWDTGASPTEPTRAGINTALTFADPAATSSTVKFAKPSSTSDYLCVLYVKAYSEGDDGDPSRLEFYVPASRSYPGADWERVAGRYAEVGEVGYGPCDDSGAVGYCELTLPDTDKLEYYVTAYKYSLTEEQKCIRFLERASFGATTAMLGTSPLDNADCATGAEAWITAQNAIAPTSHREYLRRRMNPRSLEMYKYGRTGPHPCLPNSRWRKFAFTRKDKIMSIGPLRKDWPMDFHNATLEIDANNAVWRYYDHVRTVLPIGDRPHWSDGTNEGAEIPAGTYRVCGVDETPGSTFAAESDRSLYAKFMLQDHDNNDACKHVFGGNPDVKMPADPSTLGLSSRILDFTSQSANLADIGYDPTQTTNEADSVKIFTGDYTNVDAAFCSALPDPNLSDYRSKGWRYSPYYEGFSHPNWDPSSRSVLDETVFAATPGGVVYLHDRRFTPLENTIENPLADGGGLQTIESVFVDVNTADPYNTSVTEDSEIIAVDHDENPRTTSRTSGEEQAIFCSNARPNVFNEDNCRLATSVDACVREGADDEDTAIVTMFNAASTKHPRLFNTGGSLGAMAEHLGNSSMGIPLEVWGLEYDATMWPLPCVVNSLSRWVKDEALTTEAACDTHNSDASLTFHTATGDVFKHLFQYSVSNNEHVRDIFMHESNPNSLACHADDVANADLHGFTIWLDTECWRNVHSEESNVYLINDPDWSDLGQDGMLEWNTNNNATLTTAAWNGRDNNDFQAWGRRGGIYRVANLLTSLGIYEKAGGKARTAAPTGSPSASPSYAPSSSILPSNSIVPSEALSEGPSTSRTPSGVPSVSEEPSESQQPSLVPSTSVGPSVSRMPSSRPSSQPSSVPSILPSGGEGPSASGMPSDGPSASFGPSYVESVMPSRVPSVSMAPSKSILPSWMPSAEPSQISQIARTVTDNIYEAISNDDRISAVVLETELTQKTGGVLVCGSSGEIASDPHEDDYFDYWNWRLDSTPSYSEQKKTAWTNIALGADDQLCQRTAFSLSQIFAISPSFLGYGSLSEAHANFYDGFVRNCHSTYKKVLKTVAFSVKMGMQLSHVGSKSLRYGYDRGRGVLFPDENYARESMQLETVGLDMLNMDGTVIRDALGDPIPTYDSFDILAAARLWTGFNYANRRGNYEEKDTIEINWNDPMTLNNVEHHDWFPKKDLLDNWIGDHYPLCSDMSVVDQPFLKVGATYRLLGRSSAPRYQYDNDGWNGHEQVKKFVLSTSSNLHSELCAEQNGSCTYPSVVKILSNIVCVDLECNLETLRVVQVAPDLFYEYVRRPCVHFAFFNEVAKTVFAGSGIGMCAHPSSLVATKTCCGSGDSSSSEINCVYNGELVSFAQNSEYCGSGNICPAGTNGITNQANCPNNVGYSSSEPKRNHFHWTSGSCDIKIKVRLDGMVALVHEPETNGVVRYVQNTVGNMNYFHVAWPRDVLGDELFPHIDNGCGEGTCVEQDDWTCLCEVEVEDSAGYSEEPTDVDETEIRSILKIGAFPPEYLSSTDTNRYDGGTDLGNGISVYHLTGEGYTQDSIFKISDEYDEFSDFGAEYIEGSNDGVLYLKNLVSHITIGNYTTSSYFSPPARKPLVMRNPILFHDLVKPEIRDSHYEVDAFIHHLTSHPNAPPFLSNILIQHFGISNPSPGYIERVATAYKEGTYTGPGGGIFGDGKFSNLDATVAAILLDQEALAVQLDADPAYGGIKEPIIKVLQFMRAMEYKPTHHDRNIYPKLSGMVNKVGQMAHESPDQFSFFLSDYNPPGQFSQSGLFAPAAQVLTLSTTVLTIEGFFSLARQGLSGRNSGFGSNIISSSQPGAGDFSKSVGYLALSRTGSSDEDIVGDIANLLTAGRLSTDAMGQIEAAIPNLTNENKVRFTQQLIATSPEFHTTNLAERTGNDRHPTPAQELDPEPYKAIVVLLLSGGLDSFNVLTPHASCDLYTSYRKNRGVLALRDSEMLEISSDDPSHPCTSFGVNANIPILKEIYDQGYGQFHANIGHLHKPVTKGNWRTETRTHLFSHHTMSREAQLVDAFQEGGWSTGVCGRMLDVFQRRGLSVAAIGIDGKGPMIEGNPSLGRTVDVIPSWSVNTLERLGLTDNSNDLSSIEDLMKYLNQETRLDSGVFANYWAQNLIDVLNKTDTLSGWLDEVTLENDGAFSGSVGAKLRAVAKLMLLNGSDRRSVNRDVFLITSGGHDGHALSKENLQGLLPGINSGISAFYHEMIDQNLIDNVTFVMISEFGRTITPNTGLGSDHAWGGNAFVWGGQVDGGKILGKYPETFDNADEYQIGRGRLLPYRSWDALWYGVSNWFGITDDAEIKYVLPNNGNMGCDLYTDKDMYKDGNNTVKGCNDRAIGMKLSMLLSEPRYLTGLEQKRICEAVLFLMVKNANVTSRCVVTDQEVILNYESARRRLSAGTVGSRLLTTDGIDNITISGTLSFQYDNPPNGSLAGSEYVENAAQLTEDMNELVSNNNCSASEGRRRLDEAFCDFQLDLVDEVTAFLADVTEAPSQFPSASMQPSPGPSSSPSILPSQNPSISNNPSLPPSLSHEPSDQPSAVLSSQPSIVPTAIPSQFPSISTKPSLGPSLIPSNPPSEHPSEIPSRIPSFHPSISALPTHSPSFEPSLSLAPTVPQPSSKPSIAVSSRPSRDCVDVVDVCANGGFFSPFTCECLCVTPYCPDANSGRCTATSCPQNYHETLFDDQPAPWFEHGSSCIATKDLPSSVDAIYPSKEDCCGSEYPQDSAGCIERPAGVLQLTFNAMLTLVGVSCPNSGSDRAAAVGILGRSILSASCTQVSGLTCTDGDKVIVNNFCGEEYTIEAEYSSGGRRLQNTGDDTNATLSFAFISQSIDRDKLKGIESLLSAYLQGTSLTTFSEAVVADVLASNPTQSLLSLTAVLYEAVNALIFGLGLFYPAWGTLETCLSDGNQEAYMNRDYGTWLYESLDSCCQRYYGWDTVGCTQRNIEATLVSGSSPTTNPTATLYFPDWLRTDTCINDGTAPSYMKNQASFWMYESLADCCKAYYGWADGFASCMSLPDVIPPTGSPIAESWYVDWEKFICVKSCEGTSPCGGNHEGWDDIRDSKSECCLTHLSWKEDCMEL